MDMDGKFTFSGNFIFIGFGSITRAVLPLLLKQSEITVKNITVIAPVLEKRSWFKQHGVRFVKEALTKENYVQRLNRFLGAGDFLVNLSVGVSSIDLMTHAAHAGALYLDTCIEPWDGGYDDPSLTVSQRTNYALRHHVLELRETIAKGPTAVIAHGANPGLISHLLKEALMRLARELKTPLPMTKTGLDWAVLAMEMDVKVIHVAERDTQRSKRIKQDDEFVNTWSVDGFLSEGRQPAELVWGTHEKNWPNEARQHEFGAKNSIYLERSGASVQVKTWTPVGGACLGRLITHHETISTADLLTVKKQGKVIYRPTMYYAYHPCDDALLSIHELIGNGWRPQTQRRVMCGEIAPGGIDALGVLLMGHEKNTCWYGSLLTVDEAREIAPYNTATSLQVAAGVLAGIVWALRHPDRGIVEPEQMDYEEVLELASPYLGSLVGVETDWRPNDISTDLFRAQCNGAAPWQFEQFII
ncbi:saccharopine dehydrogenase NADP-binding domain-containing protein [Pseudomonas fluorescens]|uniref:Homospermidine synthase n=1 Tax=Pseudomonas fluorescens TaxID=294 RepID=A0A5E7JVC8_PSEFL|nr:saccharopine dehydrogenase C-terminal domain-containing protein [Pseudomonas fluorescens]VVO93459.1 Homospermidine synthase [Pseudomonas fluorescens]